MSAARDRVRRASIRRQPRPPDHDGAMRDITDLSRSELRDWILAQGELPYRAEQILRWIYLEDARDFAAMSNVPQALRARLDETFVICPLSPATESVAADGTRKLLFRLDGGAAIETVLIPDKLRLTLCVSSQAGCGMGCTFCATARMGLLRNLRPGEIVGQVIAARAIARPSRITNIVFMGMGEPLANYEAVSTALEAITAPWGLGFSPRRVTVSSVGLVPAIERFVASSPVNVAISLVATTDEGRTALMPINRRYPLAELLDACRRLPLPRRRRLFFEYVLLDGVNDDEADAHRIVELLRGIPAKVNLIMFNPAPGIPFRPSPLERVLRFQRIVQAAGLQVNLRESRGWDIQAACGQLAAEAA
jgi:23S rRNA (adenine2503-C2)-methyltransferase